MRALTVEPQRANTAAVADVPDPVANDGDLLVDGLAVGVCGTDREIVDGEYGWAPPGQSRLVIGHESLGRVREAPGGSRFAVGDLVVGVVRRPDPVPCAACAHGEFDMCRNGKYVERGIKSLPGYASERWTVDEEYAVRLDPGLEEIGVLLEPTSVVAKAWEQIERIGRRAFFDPHTVLVTGAGPIGLLAALLGRQRDLDVHVLDRVTSGPKPQLVADLAATYHSDLEQVTANLRPDIVIEATGASRVIVDVLGSTSGYGIVCLTGVSAAGQVVKLDAGSLNRDLVLQNDAVVGSVNSNLRHYRDGAAALAAADADWLRRLITRTVPLDRFAEALEMRDDDVKTVISLNGDAR